ncbi:hypothetical protein R1flu_000605 [Riccia fluitans]|uniref:Uncharacterized protein n=1 Tax=Riccia fluitans TaxID=41844 RepID=A0ABD1Y0X0_9MARC
MASRNSLLLLLSSLLLLLVAAPVAAITSGETAEIVVGLRNSGICTPRYHLAYKRLSLTRLLSASTCRSEYK